MVASWNEDTTSNEVAEALKSEIKGKNVLITGVSPNGLGAEAVRVIAKYANLVVLAGRSKAKIERTIATVKAETPEANLRVLILDLSSLASARKAAEEVNSYTEPLHVLINNAAVSLTEFIKIDGVESQFYGDHLCHFLFTNLILPRIRAANTPEFSPRIINISSLGHAWSGVQFDDYNFEDGKTYTKFVGYAQSKSANILFSLELAKRLKSEGILSYSLHPGAIWTELANATKQDIIDMGLVNPDGSAKPEHPFKSIEAGTATHIVAAFDPSIKDASGGYLQDCQVHNELVAPHASDPENAKRLWTLSEQLVGEKFLL